MSFLGALMIVGEKINVVLKNNKKIEGILLGKDAQMNLYIETEKTKRRCFIKGDSILDVYN